MKVIRHADDFGFDFDTTVATIDCFRRGLLTSASIMAKMPCTSMAIQFAKAHPELSFGAHLVFVDGEHERPACDPSNLPSITDAEGRFLQTPAFRKKAILGKVCVAEVARETEAQLSILRDCGLDLSHVDSHGHVHKLGPVRQALAQVLPRFGIRRVRSAQNVFVRRPIRNATYWLSAYWERAIRRRWLTTEFFYMRPAVEEENWWNKMDDLLVKSGTLEVGFHPGTAHLWRVREINDLEAFTSTCRAHNIEWTTWNGVR